MTAISNLTEADFTNIDLFVPLLLAQKDFVNEVAEAVSTLSAEDEQLYMSVNESSKSYNDAILGLAREQGKLVQQVEREVEAVRRRLTLALIERGHEGALKFFDEEIESASQACKERTGTYVFAVMASCGDYYCEHEHLVGIYTSEAAALAIASEPKKLRSCHGDFSRFDDMEVVRIAMNEVLPDGELKVQGRYGNQRVNVRTVA